MVPPEGTRGNTRHWKTGFYYIALEAKVPIVLAYMDYERKVAGLGPLFEPTGDVERDMDEIKRFYAAVQGPQRGPVRRAVMHDRSPQAIAGAARTDIGRMRRGSAACSSAGRGATAADSRS